MSHAIVYSKDRIRQIASGPADSEAWKELAEEWNELAVFMSQVKEDRINRIREEKRSQNEQQLRRLPAFAEVFLVRAYPSQNLRYGDRLIKIRNGLKYMKCQGTTVKWNIPYKDLSAVKPTEDAIQVNREIYSQFKSLTR